MASDGKGSGGPAIARLIDPEIAAFVARTESFYPASTNRASAAENRVPSAMRALETRRGSVFAGRARNLGAVMEPVR